MLPEALLREEEEVLVVTLLPRMSYVRGLHIRPLSVPVVLDMPPQVGHTFRPWDRLAPLSRSWHLEAGQEDNTTSTAGA